jgi:type IV pilus assembly protein PilP
MRPPCFGPVVVLALVCGPVSAAAQAPPAASGPAPAVSPSAQKGPVTTLPPIESYSYDPAGRRDPFVSLVARGADAGSPAGRSADGLPGLSVNEVSVRGVLRSGGALVAMVQGPDRKTYIVHANDRFLDGTVKSVTPQGIVVLQEVNDPLSLVKQKEIRKTLRGSDEGK